MKDLLIEGNTAHQVLKKTISHVLSHGFKTETWGGTIPNRIGEKGAPNDFERTMIEHSPLTLRLTNPLARWCDYSMHWVGITLRECEDHINGYNPGHIIKYSKLYPHWINQGHFNYTYGERFCHYPFALNQMSGQMRRVGFEYNQIDKVIQLLKKHPTSRKACISTWYPPADLGNDYCPCNMVMQIRVVNGKLDWTTVIRSLDVLRGLSENIFMFTLWQEYIANQLHIPLGDYYTVALNPHIYKDQIDNGYCNQNNLPDPYDYYAPVEAFEDPYPTHQMNYIDTVLFRNGKESMDTAFRLAKNLPPYWRNWKLALISEWARLKKQFKKADTYLSKIDNEYKFSIVRRLKKQRPLCVNYLEWSKQREYLEEQ